MKRSTVTLAVGLLITAAALKLVFPARNSEVISTVSEISVISAASPVETEDAEQAASAPVTVTFNAAEYFGDTAAAPASAELPAAVEEAVETFLAGQEPFAALDLPVNVSYGFEMPSFPFVRPVTASASSSFGFRVHPLENLTKFHYGTDLAALSGDDVVSFAAGTVSEVGYDESAGNYVKISHEDGYATTYAHCGTIYVQQGQRVEAGQKIALVGVSGRVTGPHLHFELTRNGVYLNPEFYLAAA